MTAPRLPIVRQFMDKFVDTLSPDLAREKRTS